MEEKIYKLIKDCTKNNQKIEIIEADDLIIIYNNNGELSDFYYFIFMNENDFLQEKNHNFQEIYEKIKKEQIKQFDKNLNFIYFVKIDWEENTQLKAMAYEIEENPYYARKRIIFYREEILQNINDLDFSQIMDLNNLDEENSLKLDIFTGLSFLSLENFNNQTFEKSLFENIFNKNKTFEFENLRWELLGNEEDFREKINSLSDKDLILNENELSKFENEIIKLFSNSKEIKKYLYLNLENNENN